MKILTFISLALISSISFASVIDIDWPVSHSDTDENFQHLDKVAHKNQDNIAANEGVIDQIDVDLAVIDERVTALESPLDSTCKLVDAWGVEVVDWVDVDCDSKRIYHTDGDSTLDITDFMAFLSPGNPSLSSSYVTIDGASYHNSFTYPRYKGSYAFNINSGGYYNSKSDSTTVSSRCYDTVDDEKYGYVITGFPDAYHVYELDGNENFFRLHTQDKEFNGVQYIGKLELFKGEKNQISVSSGKIDVFCGIGFHLVDGLDISKYSHPLRIIWQ